MSYFFSINTLKNNLKAIKKINFSLLSNRFNFPNDKIFY